MSEKSYGFEGAVTRRREIETLWIIKAAGPYNINLLQIRRNSANLAAGGEPPHQTKRAVSKKEIRSGYAQRPISQREILKETARSIWRSSNRGKNFRLPYSTVTDLARLRGLSTSQPLLTAM